jgi:hypothetical protein
VQHRDAPRQLRLYRRRAGIGEGDAADLAVAGMPFIRESAACRYQQGGNTGDTGDGAAMVHGMLPLLR